MAAALASASAVALVIPGAGAATAQETQTRYDIPAQDLASALEAFGRQSGRSVMFDRTRVAGARSQGISGPASAQVALDRILRNTGFIARAANANTFVIEARRADERASTVDAIGGPRDQAGIHPDQSGAATPEILVTAQRGWSLNTDIRRTRDDAQPYIIFDREQIRRSGATTIEQFFRDNLNVSANPNLNDARPHNSQGGTLNLRGLGVGETLILVDGRRIAPLNSENSGGRIEQPVLQGIPLNSIERIEVLASSASGIYGGSATGGVVNIVLKRDYRGFEVTANYGDSYGGGGASRRIDASGGLKPWGGGSISFSGSWQKKDALEFGQRDFLVDYNRRFFELSPPSNEVLLSSMPNIRSVTGAILTLDPIYGGTSLGSSFTSVPTGYRGIALDGAAGLIANAGQYNTELAPSIQSSTFGLRGRRATLFNATENLSGMVAVRQEVTPWLRVFGEFAANRDEGLRAWQALPSTVQLAASAPNNPFQQAIYVSVIDTSEPRYARYRTDGLRATGGVIVELPHEWHGSADYAWNQTRSDSGSPLGLSTAFWNSLTSRANVIRDQIATPWDIDYLAVPSNTNDRKASTTTASLRLAGPLPIGLPGGRPTISMHVQRTDTRQAGAVSYNSFWNSGQINYSVPRDARNDAAYFEARIPLFSSDNAIPFIRSLEFSVAGRYERYRVDGANALLACIQPKPSPLDEADLAVQCPPPDAVIERAIVSRSSFNPTYSVKWHPADDLALRASYATGYRPQEANQLISASANMPIFLTDPLRGNGPIGTGLFLPTIPMETGGNPNLRPEHSDSYTVGAILTPKQIPNLRLSVDWTRIIKRDNYYDPGLLILGAMGGPDFQTIFNDFIAANPDRVTRNPDPASFGGFSVGPITHLDMRLVNIAGSKVGALDFAADYSTKALGGTLDFSLAASWAYEFKVQFSPNTAEYDFAGVSALTGFETSGGVGSPEWRGNATVHYRAERWGLGVRSRATSSYRLSAGRNIVEAQGERRVRAQTYFDVFANYRLFEHTEIAAGARNVFDKAPPYDATNPLRASGYGDVLGGNYYISITQRF